MVDLRVLLNLGFGEEFPAFGENPGVGCWRNANQQVGGSIEENL